MFKRYFFIVCVLFFAITENAFSQEKNKESQENFVPPQVAPPGGPVKNRKAPKKSKIEEANVPKGRSLIAEHRQKQRKHTWNEGEKLMYKLKDDPKLYKGVINRIVPGKFVVDSVEIKISDVEMLKARLFSLMKEKSKGYAQIGLSIPILAVGTYVIIFSFESIDNESPTVVASALGMTLGAAIDLYGMSVLKKGLKTAFAGRKMRTEKGWVIKIR